MRKILILLLALFTLAGCNNTPAGLELSVRKNKISWTNGTIRFQTEMDSKRKRHEYAGFKAYLRLSDGREIQMPSQSNSLGYGASFPMGTSGMYSPDNGYSLAETMLKTDDRMIIRLHHDPWPIFDEPITLDKQITLYTDSPIMYVIDYYTGAFDLLNVAAEISAAKAGTVKELEKGFLVEYSNGVTAIIIMPEMQEKLYDESEGRIFVSRGVKCDEPLSYYVGISDKGQDYLLEELAKIM